MRATRICAKASLAAGSRATTSAADAPALVRVHVGWSRERAHMHAPDAAKFATTPHERRGQGRGSCAVC